MPMTDSVEYLSFGDSLFLYLEREGAPLNIASLTTFEGKISPSDFRKFVASKLQQIPRYLQKVVIPPLGLGSPYWEFVSDFNLSDHVHDVELKHGTEAELKKVVARLLSPAMDRKHPLWDMTLIRGLAGNRTALLARLHHCLADGISGMGVLGTILDVEPSVPVLKNTRVRVPSEPKPAGDDILDSAMRSWFSIAERLLRAGSEVLTLLQRASGLSQNGNGAAGDQQTVLNANKNNVQMARLASELSNIPERLPFNTLCHGPQRYEWTQADMADFKAIHEKSGVMVNDVILTVVTSAFSRYSELHGAKVRGKSMRVVVPVSTRRHHSELGQMGNHITFAPFSAPLGIRNPKRLLSAIHDRMQFVKSAHVADFVAFAGTLLGTIPAPLQAALAPVVSGLPITLCNTICTSVPGPKRPLYLMGHEMLSAYPYVPIGGEMGINCAVLTYNGKVFFGFTGDTGAAPDLEVMPKFVDRAVAELKREFSIRTQMPRVRKIPPEQIAVPPEIAVQESVAEMPREKAEPEREKVAAAAA